MSYPKFHLAPIISKGLAKPVFLTHAGDGSGRLFVVEQNGRVLILQNGHFLAKPFLDMSPRIATGGERGLLGLAFHPHFSQNGRFFVNYTRAQDGATIVEESHARPGSNVSTDEKNILLVIPQPFRNHNGGMIAFGQDGFLYIGMGDGGAAGDPGNRAQDPRSLLGKILRIDVDGGPPYAIPPTNPFIGQKARPEIFALGFRNPWRFSFDRQTNHLWVADVGQDAWEEVDVAEAGKNYGWRLMEGRHCFHPPTGCYALTPLMPPILEYAHRGGRCSVIGGLVYRGGQAKSLIGTYLFADFCSGEIFGFRDGRQEMLLKTDFQISSFGTDEAGNVYVLGYEGSIHLITDTTEP